MSRRNTATTHMIDRRSLFTSAVAAGAVAVIPQVQGADAAPAGTRPSAADPSAAALARETQQPQIEHGTDKRSGGDYMVDALKHLDIPYAATMAGSSFRGLHESLINYGGNKQPELLTCLHEEISIGIAHGYAKTTNKPLVSLLHGAVGIQHAAMAVYNAWCDQVPMLLIGGNTLDGTKRREGVEWNHSVLDQGATLRDFLKWDAQPISLPDFNEALKRGYQLATSAPCGPVLIMADSDMQEGPISEALRPEPLLMSPTQPVGDPAALNVAAKLLVAAANPVIVVDKMARTQAAMNALVELAELLQCPVIDRFGRFNMPNTHYLAQTELGRSHLQAADVILGLELTDPYGTVNNVVDAHERYSEPLIAANAKFIHLSSRSLLVRANYQNFQRLQPAELAITGDAEASLPYLIDAVQRAMSSFDRVRIDGRKTKLEAGYKDMKQRSRLAATYGWNATPIASGRMCAELYNQVRHLDWTVAGYGGGFIGGWMARLWDIDRRDKAMFGSGGAGVGVGGPAGLGAALAHRGSGRIPISFVGDGDLLVCTSSLWTAAHHQIPIMYVVFNNRAYHQERMHIQRMANRYGRGVDQTHIGTTIDTPNIDFAKLAQGYGAVGIGPITDPDDLASAFKRAVEVVRSGQPVLVDVVAQPR